jgi:hypothetical protein
MVAWWPGDDSTPYDLLGEHDGTYEGAPFSPYIWKVGGGALGFQTTPGTYIRVPHDPELDPGPGEITIDLWINTETTAGSSPIVEKLGISGFQLGISLGRPVFIACDDQVCWAAQAVETINDGEWHHLAGTLSRGGGSGDELKLYVDGELAASTPVELGTVSCEYDLLIGASPSSGTPSLFVDAVMDEIEIYDRALTETEIRMIYAADSFGKCKDLCPGAINGDGVVNVQDFLELLAAWGACP